MTPSQESEPLGESVVEEVRAIRQALDDAAGHDLRKLAEHAQRTMEELCRAYGMKIVEIPPRRTRPLVTR